MTGLEEVFRRFLFALAIAAVWAISIFWQPLAWVLLGAGIIGILGSIGLEPPSLRRLRHTRQVRRDLRSLERKGYVVVIDDRAYLTGSHER